MDVGCFANESPFRNQIVTVQGVDFFVNQGWLSEQSPFFDTKIAEAVEARPEFSWRIVLKDHCPQEFLQFLLVMGMDINQLRKEVNADNFPTMMKYAKIWSIVGLRQRCLLFLSDMFGRTNPSIHRDIEIFRACMKFGFDSHERKPALERLGYFGFAILRRERLEDDEYIDNATIALLFGTASSESVYVPRDHDLNENDMGQCSVIECDKVAPTCGNCGFLFCIDHLSIDCSKGLGKFQKLSDLQKREERSATKPSVKLVPTNYYLKNLCLH